MPNGSRPVLGPDENPYLDAYQTARGGEPFSFREREARVTQYSWAIPNEKALFTIRGGGPLVEMGAGGGYWAAMLAARGANIIAYDRDPTGSSARFQGGELWFPVLEGSPSSLALHADRGLLLVWPPYDDPMAAECLAYYRGNRVYYVGEGEGGCTGDDAFHAGLKQDFRQLAHIEIPQWNGIHDYLSVYVRK